MTAIVTVAAIIALPTLDGWVAKSAAAAHLTTTENGSQRHRLLLTALTQPLAAA